MMKVECCICVMTFMANEGIFCVEPQQDHHFVCHACLNDDMEFKFNNNEVLAEGHIKCKRECGGRFSLASISALVGRSIEPQFMERWHTRMREVYATEINTRYTKQIEDLRRAAQEAPLVRHVNHITEMILNLACPRCGQVFNDFTGCFALTCSRCNCGFCAYCLLDCGGDAHPHVRVCPRSLNPGNYFATQATFEAAHRQRKLLLLREYFATIEDRQTRIKVLEKIRPNINEYSDAEVDFV